MTVPFQTPTPGTRKVVHTSNRLAMNRGSQDLLPSLIPVARMTQRPRESYINLHITKAAGQHAEARRAPQAHPRASSRGLKNLVQDPAAPEPPSGVARAGARCFLLILQFLGLSGDQPGPHLVV